MCHTRPSSSKDEDDKDDAASGHKRANASEFMEKMQEKEDEAEEGDHGVEDLDAADDQVEDDLHAAGVPTDDVDSKAAFQALRGEYQNSWHLCAALYQDRDLQKRLRLIAMCLGPLEAEFFRDIERQSLGQDGLVAWAADRVAGSWHQCIVETLQLMHSSELFRRLGVTVDNGPVVPMTGDAMGRPWVQEELYWAQLTFNLVVEIASARAWSQQMFGILMPNITAGLLSTVEQRRDGTMQVMQRLANALLEAEKNCHIAGLRKVLNDIAFHKTQLVRELFKIGEDCGWDSQCHCLLYIQSKQPTLESESN